MAEAIAEMPLRTETAPRTTPKGRTGLDGHIAELEKKHKALDTQIIELQGRPSSDDLHIVELKRKKLLVKDEIERLRPDTPRVH